jgi:hypothetical protein
MYPVFLPGKRQSAFRNMETISSPVKRKSILGKYFLDNLKILLSFY